MTEALAPVFVDGLGHGVEDGPALVRGAALARRDAADDLVPYAAAGFAWNVPSRPVRPCTSRRVDLSIKTAMCHPLPARQLRRPSWRLPPSCRPS